jgi:ubiquitin
MIEKQKQAKRTRKIGAGYADEKRELRRRLRVAANTNGASNV